MFDIHTRPAVHPSSFIVVAFALAAFGLVMVASAVAPAAESVFGANFWRTPFGRQAVFVLIGLAALILVAFVGRPVLAAPAIRDALAWTLFVLVVGCLAAALVPGLTDSHRGSRRWLRLGGAGLSFQPSEFAKPALVIILATLFSRRAEAPRLFWKDFLPAAAAIGIVAMLVGSQNLGTAALLAAVGGTMLLTAGCRMVHLMLVGSAGVSALGFLLVVERYRLDRLTSYTRMWEEMHGKGYQPLQSLATIASGGWFGTGLGAGVQKQGYLPESHTDFIFSVLCEETGVLGACLVIGLFGVMIWLGLRTMWNAPSRFERLTAFGLTATMGLQAVMNIAVVTVVTPTTGISLPLISAGGSGMIAYCIAIGLLAAIAARTRLIERSAPRQTTRRPLAGLGSSEREAFAW